MTPGVSQEALRRRAGRLRAELHRLEADGLLVTSLANLRWLTGFPGTTAAAVVTAGSLYFVTDLRYSLAVERLRAEGALPVDLELVVAEPSYDEAIAGLLERLGLRRVAFEAEHLTVRRFRWLTERLARRAAPLELVPTEAVVERLRAVKDAEEIALFREAGARLAEVAAALPVIVRRGRSERRTAADLDTRLRRAGFERPAFDTIVASGPNSALPHARAGERRLAPGDPIVLDFGGVYRGYCVDLTRTVFLGRPPEAFERLYAAVRAARSAALAVTRPGARASLVDQAVRQELTRHGFGGAVAHAAGHGLGLEVHEYPRLGRARSEADDPVLAAGMVLAIEPAAYLPALGGARLEDDVLVTDAGYELLTPAPRDLLVL
ncbi:MAG TPA: Xaa-Pro peptidase family protein [Vicinamibacterales bacterium]|nr:Xaa-Pro peptidase family protein [Vicinamibacterales bacterium]